MPSKLKTLATAAKAIKNAPKAANKVVSKVVKQATTSRTRGGVSKGNTPGTSGKYAKKTPLEKKPVIETKPRTRAGVSKGNTPGTASKYSKKTPVNKESNLPAVKGSNLPAVKGSNAPAVKKTTISTKSTQGKKTNSDNTYKGAKIDFSVANKQIGAANKKRKINYKNIALGAAGAGAVASLALDGKDKKDKKDKKKYSNKELEDLSKSKKTDTKKTDTKKTTIVDTDSKKKVDKIKSFRDQLKEDMATRDRNKAKRQKMLEYEKKAKEEEKRKSDSVSIEQKVKDTMSGKYGNGEARRKALGADYNKVQAEINKRMSSSRTKTVPAKSVKATEAVAEKTETNKPEVKKTVDTSKRYQGSGMGARERADKEFEEKLKLKKGGAVKSKTKKRY